MEMKENVFNVMTAGDKENRQYIREEMEKNDAIGKYPYYIYTPNWEYKISKLPEPLHSQYGLQYTANQRHK